MRIALVTGGNRGIGLEVCRELAEDGWTVWLAARGRQEGEEAARQLAGARGEVVPVQLDVTDPESIRRMREALVGRDVRLHALVNNAGVFGGRAGPSALVAGSGGRSSDARTVVDTNFFGALRVFDAVADRLEDGARIVNVTSGLGALSNLDAATRRRLVDPALTRAALVSMVEAFVEGRDDWGTSAYGVSKSALNAWTRIVARELAPRGIKVNAASPGWAKTRMGGEGAPRTVEQGAASVLWGVKLGVDGPTGGVFQDGRPLE